MGWSIGYDPSWKRDIGYGVPATCDHPGCGAEIDRGFGFVCGGDAFGGDHGCGLFFCGMHLLLTEVEGGRAHWLCERCDPKAGREPFEPTPDLPIWLRHKLRHPSWRQWRAENPADVVKIREALRAAARASGLTAGAPQASPDPKEPTHQSNAGLQLENR